jgi:predicted transcriptional regulator
VVKSGLAKALERKMGQDEGILTKIKTKGVGSSLLMNPSRRAIFEFICNNPCSHLRKISRYCEFSAQTARWHLLKLVDNQLISQDDYGTKKIYSPLTNYIKSEECQIFALLNNADIRAIYLCIENHPKISQKQLSISLGIYQQLLSRSLLILERNNLIAYEKKAREKVYFITNKLKGIEEVFKFKAPHFEKELILALTNDGVDPKIISSDSDLIKIKIDSGGNKHSVLSINKNPVNAILNVD